MADTLSPVPKLSLLDNNGKPAVGYKLFTYQAGTSTKLATYTSSSGIINNSNPIILDYRGEANVWVPPNISYKYVFARPDDTDPPGAPIWTVDNIVSQQLLTLYGGVDSGTANAYILNFTANFSAYEDGIVIYWFPSSTNTGPSTINVNGLGIVNILNYDGSSLSANQIIANSVTGIMYTAGSFVIFTNSLAVTSYSSSFTPTWGGFGGSPPTGTMYYQVVGTQVTLNWVGSVGTSNATFLSILNLPISIRPAHSSGATDGAMVACAMVDNNITKLGGARITTSGTVNFCLGATPSESGFTNSGNKGLLNGWSLVYGTR